METILACAVPTTKSGAKKAASPSGAVAELAKEREVIAPDDRKGQHFRAFKCRIN